MVDIYGVFSTQTFNLPRRSDDLVKVADADAMDAKVDTMTDEWTPVSLANLGGGVCPPVDVFCRKNVGRRQY